MICSQTLLTTSFVAPTLGTICVSWILWGLVTETEVGVQFIGRKGNSCERCAREDLIWTGGIPRLQCRSDSCEKEGEGKGGQGEPQPMMQICPNKWPPTGELQSKDGLAKKSPTGQKCHMPHCAQSRACGCSERTEVDPDDSADRGCLLTALLAAEWRAPS